MVEIVDYKLKGKSKLANKEDENANFFYDE